MQLIINSAPFPFSYGCSLVLIGVPSWAPLKSFNFWSCKVPLLFPLHLPGKSQCPDELPGHHGKAQVGVINLCCPDATRASRVLSVFWWSAFSAVSNYSLCLIQTALDNKNKNKACNFTAVQGTSCVCGVDADTNSLLFSVQCVGPGSALQLSLPDFGWIALPKLRPGYPPALNCWLCP